MGVENNGHVRSSFDPPSRSSKGAKSIMQHIKPQPLPDSFSFSSQQEVRIDSVLGLQPCLQLGRYESLSVANPGYTLVTEDGKFPPAVSDATPISVPDELINTTPGAGDNSDKPIWIAGSPRLVDGERFIPILLNSTPTLLVALVPECDTDRYILDLILEAPELKARDLQMARAFM